MRAYRNYRGVKIYRLSEMHAGADFEGRKPKREDYDVFYHWTDGPKCDTLKEIKADINDLIDAAASVGCDEKAAVLIVNSGGE